ncbi:MULTISPECIES: AAA family ATPase [Trichocoleus]|uniref:AAA family ATPase n=1 Tax=Trichocoleus desertorum GB2-A4 TaxID=2933944 RepID=A0ABV0JBZ0_9CYAN|nr:AAA family ATPase [Trichocoleus sp. FACHB-46]MBD1865440.1 AAA family ATPase [Trichocoleus sp. FACHB-46]
MISLPNVIVQGKLYESRNSLVYRGIRKSDHLPIILKVLKQDYPTPSELIRYKQEYEITQSLNLEGVIKAYAQQDYQRTLVILLEDFGGKSLEKWIRDAAKSYCPMPLPEFLRFAITVTKILGDIHTANVIHKDINPSNIVLNPQTGQVKVIDFGISTRLGRTNPTFNNPHILEGTLAYISPEQTGRMNRSLDYRTDFYSLGITFYELLTGQLPFPTADILELVHCHIAKQPVPPHELNAEIPKAMSDMVLKLMAKNAEDRYQSAWGIKADLELCAQQLTETDLIGNLQLGLHDVSDQFQIPQKLYGRSAEIAALLASFDRVAARIKTGITEIKREENTGDIDISRSSIPIPSERLLVSGYAGVGKSALVQELYKPITARRGYFVSGKFDQLQRNTPYSAIAHALQKLVQQLLGEPDEQLQQWRSRLLAALGSNGQLVVDVIPELELIVGKQPPVIEVGATEAQNRFNRIFQQFLRVFCSESHPLVIFLDDLQWIDSATLKLIGLMLLDEQAQSLFLIGAYRDNEVHPTHPLTLALESLRKQGAVFQEIVLRPLMLEPLSQLLAETLHQDVETVRSLAQLVLRKTEGTPFFVNEFLRMLYGQNLLTFDAAHRSWQWNIAQIEAQNITDNVVDLMLVKLKKLPKDTQRLLRLAACIGSEFDLDTLALVCEQSSNRVFRDLLPALQEGFIQPLSELDQDLLFQQYKFLHDRVQQTAYALIDPSQKHIIHLQIGRNLLEKTLLEPLSDWLFKSVDHLNYGINLVTDADERIEIAKLNLMAGRKAKAAIAYRAAKKYLAQGREWLTFSSWQSHYNLTLELYIETTEVSYLCGEFEDVEQWAGVALIEAKTVLDSVKLYEIKVQAYIAQKQLVKAINTALQVLQQLGISFPKTPTPSEIRRELDATTSLFDNCQIGDLIHLPEMIELEKLAAMRILSSITITAQIAAPNLTPLLASKQVNLSILYGNAFVSPFAYATFGLILCGVVGNIESGYEFGQLAIRLLSQCHTHALKARTLNIVNNFIIHWKEHARELLKPLLEGYQSGLETGDLEFAAYCAYTYCFQSYANGKELIEVEHNMAIYGEAIRQIKQETAYTWNQIFRQAIINLTGQSANPTQLVGESYNEDNELPKYESRNDGSSIFSVYFNKLFLCYLFSEYAQAVENGVLAGSYLIRLTGTSLEPLYYLYISLARLAIYPESSNQVQKELLQEVTLSQEKMKLWAHHAPMNYLHKYNLVQAETAQVLGQWFEAEEFYEQAIQGARENEYIQEEALAYELAAKHYLARGREKFAQTYMKEAHYCYERWGATVKVKDLETRYPQFFPQASDVVSPTYKTSETTSNRSDLALDLAAVLKASQAISSEIELDQLLRSLMQILIETAGAQTGCLILENAGEWAIEAACELSQGENVCTTRVLQSLPTTNHLPESIIQYVIRTHESVILNDATREGNFIHDPYIQHHKTRSLLCLPLLNQSKLVGVLYLENQLATGVFSPERSQVLNLLSSQAAIAIENAKLYSKLRTSESHMTQFLEAVQVGIGVLDATGRPYYVNQRGTQLLGKGIDPVASPDYFSEIYQVYLSGTNQIYPTEKMPIVRALNGERTRIDDMEIHQNDKIIPVEVWGTPIFDEQGNVTYAIAAFQDITERRQTEQLLTDYNRTLEQQVAERTVALQKSEAELRRREQELRLITDTLPALVAYVDGNRRYQFINRTYEVWFNRSRDEILGRYVHELLDETVYQRVEPFIHQVFTGQTVSLEAEVPFPVGKKSISATLIPDFDVNAQVGGFYSLITDISDQKRAEEASILEERNRMAREIHDTLAQAFTGILLHTGAATELMTKKPETAQAHLETVDELARTGLAEARRSVTTLRPKLLEEGNLYHALNHLTHQMKSSTKTHLTCQTIGEVYALLPDVENNLLRIGQEALTNAIKYANATEICIELVYEKTQCLLRVKDDGQGFEVEVYPTQGFGLLGMSERVEQIGGELTISSQPNQGTEIIVIVNRE